MNTFYLELENSLLSLSLLDLVHTAKGINKLTISKWYVFIQKSKCIFPHLKSWNFVKF